MFFHWFDYAMYVLFEGRVLIKEIGNCQKITNVLPAPVL